MTQVLNDRKIAIIDDDKNLAELTAWEVEEAGYQPFLLDNRHFRNVSELVSLIRENAQGAVCDHRLSNSGFANFYGAELVANLYDCKFPSLLITQYRTHLGSFSVLRRSLIF